MNRYFEIAQALQKMNVKAHTPTERGFTFAKSQTAIRQICALADEALIDDAELVERVMSAAPWLKIEKINEIVKPA